MKRYEQKMTAGVVQVTIDGEIRNKLNQNRIED
jgi:hypothetical protein